MRSLLRPLALVTALFVSGCGDGTGPNLPASVEIVDAPSQVMERRTAVLQARVTDAEGHPLTNPAVQWNSSNPAAAAVSFEGELTAIAAGTTTITARTGAAAASVPIEVILVPVDAVALDLGGGYMSVGQVKGVALYAANADGRVKDRQVEWSISDSTLATLRTTGFTAAELLGLKPGTLTVTATLEAHTASGKMEIGN